MNSIFQRNSFFQFLYSFVLVSLVFVRILSFLFMLKGWSSMLPDLNLPSVNLPELPHLMEEEIQIVDEKINARKNIERWVKAIGFHSF